MWGAFLDESFEPNNKGVFAVAAVFGDGWDVLDAQERWRTVREKHNIKVFKANKLRDRPSVLAEFTKAFCDSGLIACGIVGMQPDILEAVKGTKFHEQYRQSPYMLLYQTLFVTIGMDIQKVGRGGVVSFVCDENLRYKDILLRSYPELRRKNPNSAVHMGSCTTDTDELCIPLQMADLVARELRIRAPEWIAGGNRLTPNLKMLIEAGKIWSVPHMNRAGCDMVRSLVGVIG